MPTTRIATARGRPTSLLFLLVGFLVSCGPVPTTAGGDRSAQVEQDASAVVGPVVLSVERADYEGSDGTVFRSQGRTRLFLTLKNSGRSPIALFALAEPRRGNTTPQAMPPYYLLDDAGGKYPATGKGWTTRVGDQRGVEGTALSGQTVEFTLEFEEVPRGVGALSLVMDRVRSRDGQVYRFTLPLRIPPTGGGP